MGLACNEGLQFPKPILEAGGIHHMYQCVVEVSLGGVERGEVCGVGEESKGEDLWSWCRGGEGRGE